MAARWVCAIGWVWCGLVGTAAAAVYTVTNAADSGVGTLRDCIQQANTNPGSHTIAFNLPAPHVIAPTSQLPPVANAVWIDGSTQPGYTGAPVVRINGASVSLSGGLLFNVRGGGAHALYVTGFTNGSGVALNGQSNRVSGCWCISNHTGVSAGGSNAWVGGTAVAQRNVLSLNRYVGLNLFGPGYHQVQGNYIGLDPAGVVAWSNANRGVDVSAPHCVIGGPAAGARNVVSGHGGPAIYLINAAGTEVSGNFLGTDASGTNALPNDIAVQLVGRSNLIGGASTAHRNIMAGNRNYGVYLGGTNATRHVIQGNFIGLDAAGRARPNGYPGNAGVFVLGGSNTVIGNVISGNGGHGVYLSGTAARGNVVGGNLIGLDPAGTQACPNAGNGVYFYGGASENQVIGLPFRNVIAGNAAAGVGIVGTDCVDNVVQGNFIGTDLAGARAVSNGNAGVLLEDVVGAQIADNLIAGNRQAGVEIGGADSRDVVLVGNQIGCSAAGTNALPNAGAGVRITHGRGHRVGGPTSVDRNVISGNALSGVLLGGNYSNVTVAGNYIGLAPDGLQSLGNVANGIGVIVAGAGLLISNNVIAGNGSDGIALSGANTPAAAVLVANRIGLDAAGALARTNTGHGVSLIKVSGVRVGGATAGERNVIAGNTGSGIVVEGSGSNEAVVIAGNYIGLDAGGLNGPGNGQDGLYVRFTPRLQVGGSSTAWKNVIAYHDTGLSLEGCDGAWIGYNFIGCDASATLARPNGYGLFLFGACRSNLVENNIVSGNSLGGVLLQSGPVQATLRGNRIGVGSIAALPNTGPGLHLLDTADHQIGGPAAADANLIAFNAGPGVLVVGSTPTSSVRNRIQGNLIYSNAAPEIDLGGDGATANDPAPDADAGANGLQNHPTLTFASVGATNISGNFAGAPGSVWLEFFARTPAAGVVYLGGTNLFVPPAGQAAFSFRFATVAPVGSVIRATATTADGTSEFSPAIGLTAGSDSDGDLMPDWWEAGHFLDPAVSNAVGSDADGDGASDLEEWIADTIPTASDSLLRIVAVTNGASRTVLVPSSGLRLYSLESASGPESGIWTVALTNVPGTGGLLALPDASGYTQRVYRVGVKRP